MVFLIRLRLRLFSKSHAIGNEVGVENNLYGLNALMGNQRIGYRRSWQSYAGKRTLPLLCPQVALASSFQLSESCRKFPQAVQTFLATFGKQYGYECIAMYPVVNHISQ